MKKFIYIGALFLGGITLSYAQKVQVKKADKLYDNYNYIDAVETYEKVAQKGYKSAEIFQKLGNSYYFNANYNESAKWYGELFELEPVASDPEYYFRYAQSLKSVGEYTKADEYMEKFYQAKGDDHRAKLFLTERNYLEVIEENSYRYAIENAEILNSDLSDFGTSFYNGELIFTSTRKGSKLISKNMGWNDQPFSVLYSSKVNQVGNLEEPKVFSEKLDSKVNESTPVFTKDGTTIYFSRNNYLKKKGYSSEGVTKLKIYRANLKDGKWSDVTELPFNSDEYNVAHPALSPDEKWLYFASDMPGTMGDADIWKAEINGDGSFGTPINLGPTINTEGRESFPSITDENELYYASTGKPGLGGMDIFMSKISDDGQYSEAVNVGKPINGPMDDFGFYINTKSRVGFFTSNRDGGHGYDDIYKFTEYKKLICEHLITGVVTDVDTGEPLAEAEVSLFDRDGKVIATTLTDEEGAYIFENDVNCNRYYRVRAGKEEYSTEEKYAQTPDEEGTTQVDIALKIVKIIPEICMELNKFLNIPPIYFDLDKWNIRPDAEIQIAKVLEVMKQYPEMKVEIGSHTDCRQTYAYNERLSDRRAKSTREWLIKNGIAPDRLTAKGYGETQLVNDCACEPTNESHCTEEQHQLNRRSIFKITSMGGDKVCPETK